MRTELKNIPEIEIKIYEFPLFDKKIHLVSQSNHYSLLKNFFSNLENMDWEDAKKELVLEYFALETPDVPADLAWKNYQRIPQRCTVLSSISHKDIEIIKSHCIEHKRNSKIDTLLN